MNRDMVISWFDDAWRSKTEQIECLLDIFHGIERKEKKETCDLKKKTVKCVKKNILFLS